ncbi:hypothetical protein O1L55_18580 [Streptomyces albulus]|nr:hypothetical protein [Streptomyces noursei]
MATVMAAPAARGVVGMVAAARRGAEVGTAAGHPPTPPPPLVLRRDVFL